MPKTLARCSTALNPGLVAFTPRQVLLAKMTGAKHSALDKEGKAILLLSIAQYLQKNGFSKTLKKFKDEAQIEEDGWKDSKLDLEEICLKFLDTRINISTCSNGLDQDGKKKKSKKKSENGNDKEVKAENDSVTLSKESQEFQSEKSKEPGSDASRELQHNQVDKKRKEKKRDHISVSVSFTEEENQQIETIPEQANILKSENLKTSKSKNDASSEVEKKSRDKKTKKSKSTSNEVANDVEERQDLENSKSMMDIKQNGSGEETINSDINKKVKRQKRKRLESEGNDNQPVEKEPVEKLKRRRKENQETMASEQKSEVKASQNDEVNLLKSQMTTSKHQNGNESACIDKTAEKSASGKDMKRCNGSAEPQSTTTKAFQRIKADEVEFADERLKDNSYWAKGGAEIGYGAKAQEVLGQVRGKDFRHEKTKKKRGSYRGGQIDLQTHSVKFNYSDDE
ncbi:hypothetical protein SAY87_019099 [Trapa incisa]|uniref:LisH domain-containing protein n=1 Tax=Trapa incisa TaxID=236973 RepID=A0AAN7JYP3_9MYRT|nr:hypothetical protein SAY87_019099 [Trapa incisa]